MTACRRNPVLPSRALIPLFFFFLSIHSLHAQRPSERYKAALQADRLEPRVRTFVTACLHTAALPRAVALYSQGAWFVTPSLPEHMKQQGSNDDGTAQVWQLDGKPRAASLWIHDDEFDRSTVACLDDKGLVTRQVNEYMPGLSEPELHYISVHSFTLGPHGKYRVSYSYTGWNRVAIPAPRLTSEDRDFIAGERQYLVWKDFDFADVLQRQ